MNELGDENLLWDSPQRWELSIVTAIIQFLVNSWSGHDFQKSQQIHAERRACHTHVWRTAINLAYNPRN